MQRKTCFITGGNSGIGLQASIQLAKTGFHVIIGARNQQRGNQAVETIKRKANSDQIELVLIDLSSMDSILEASKKLKKKLDHLDVLIHNAADFDITRKQPLQSVDGIETIWATNHIGPIMLTDLMMELLKKSEQGRIITIASKGLMMHPYIKVKVEDPEFKHRKFSVPKAYYQSKLAQVMYTYWLAEKLKNTSITVNCIRVTNVKIDIERYPHIGGFMKFLYSIKSRFSISPEEMAETYTFLATSPELKTVTGKYFDENNKVVTSSKYSMNEQNIDEVMELSYSYINRNNG